MRLSARRRPAVRPARPARAGMSLIEIIVAMTLLAIVLSSLAYLAGAAATRAKDVSRNTYRAALSSELTDRYITMPYDTLPNYALLDTVTAGNRKYVRRVTVVLDGTSTVRRKVTVTVVPLGGTTKADTLTTTIFRARPNTENVLNTGV